MSDFLQQPEVIDGIEKMPLGPTDWYYRTFVPKDPADNVAFRMKMLKRAFKSRKYARELWMICSRDLLFYINCIAAGTRVVTDRGLVAIENVTPHDRVWDGEGWVSQGGSVHKGSRRVIDAYGIALTPDHKVMTTHGWQIADRRYDRKEVRTPDGYFSEWPLQEDKASGLAVSVRLRKHDRCGGKPTAVLDDEELWVFENGRDADGSRNGEHQDPQRLDVNEVQVPQQKKHGISSIWREGNCCVRTMAGEFSELSERHGECSSRDNSRENQQRRTVLSRELSLGHSKGAVQQYSTKRVHRDLPRTPLDGEDCRDCGRVVSSDTGSSTCRNDGRRVAGAEHEEETIAEVYDLLNCGPKRAFTVIDRNGRALLVHNCFGMILEPREPPHSQFYNPQRPFKSAREIPFITRQCQDEVFLEMWKWAGKKDQRLLKSREMGASWMFLYLADHFWRFSEQCHIGMASKDEAAVDAPGSTDSLFWKLDFINDKLPWFLSVHGANRKRNSADHMIINVPNNSTIQGFAATANVATGGRKFMFIFDEMAKWAAHAENGAQTSTQYVTPCRIYVSTPDPQKAQSGAFYEICTSETSDVVALELPWWKDPEKGRGLYTAKGRDIRIIDKSYNFPPDYPFVNDGRKRSPYYDWECRRPGSTARTIAAELDMDFGGAGNNLFDPETMARMRKTMKPPAMRAAFMLDANGDPTTRLMDDAAGPILLWVKLDSRDDGSLIIPKGDYVIGCDIALGTGGGEASQSAAACIDIEAKQLIWLWMDRNTNPTQMGDIVWCLGNAWSSHTGKPALLVPEINGPGAQFATAVMARGYSNPYWRKRSDNTKNVFLTDNRSDAFGLYNSDRGMAILLAMQDGVLRNGFKPMSERIVTECGRYVIGKDGKASHPRVKQKEGEDKSHGDCAIAVACAWWAIRHHSTPLEEVASPVAKPGSAAYRRLEWLRDKANTGLPYWQPTTGVQYR